MFEKYYQSLGIPEDADEKTLKKAFRKLALKLHPDVNRSPDANLRFQELCEAYEVVLRNIKNQTTFHIYHHYEKEEPDYSYEDVIREAREAANKRARMKYEKMKAERELFEQSIWRDIALLINYTGRITLVSAGIFLIFYPIFLIVFQGLQKVLSLAFLWVIGVFILYQIFNARRTYFRQGKIRWHFDEFLNIFDFKPITEKSERDCFYSIGEKANFKPFKLQLLKIRNVSLQNNGVSYNRKIREVIIPRSVKARKVHFTQSVIKISSISLSLVLVPFPDIFLRLIFGLIFGGILALIPLIILRTRSKVSYLLNIFLLVKIALWAGFIISQTTMHRGFILETSIYTPYYIFALLIFGDMFIDLVCLPFSFHNKLYQPLISQGPLIDGLYREGYQNYLDIPIWSTVHPLFTWIF